MLKHLVQIWRDERGAQITVENIGWVLLMLGAVALVGYGLTALMRGKAGAIMTSMQNMKAMQGEVNAGSSYSYSVTTDTNTGIATGATGN